MLATVNSYCYNNSMPTTITDRTNDNKFQTYRLIRTPDLNPDRSLNPDPFPQLPPSPRPISLYETAAKAYNKPPPAPLPTRSVHSGGHVMRDVVP